MVMFEQYCGIRNKIWKKKLSLAWVGIYKVRLGEEIFSYLVNSS